MFWKDDPGNIMPGDRQGAKFAPETKRPVRMEHSKREERDGRCCWKGHQELDQKRRLVKSKAKDFDVH